MPHYTTTAKPAAMIVPTEHEKAEWSRMAQAAYSSDRNSIGHRYSAAASLPRRGGMYLVQFDELQADYRSWLLSGFGPEIVADPEYFAESARVRAEAVAFLRSGRSGR